MEEILREVNGEELNEQGLPPGFRFHPTDEELITFYLASKVFKSSFSGVEIAEVDLNRCEPWELPDVAKMGEREWYLYSLRDRKYPTGLRTNRATGAGYWKATGKDREVYSAFNGCLLGMKKTLVFYKGRAPRGEKTKWVMHEYRLDGHFSYRHACKLEEEWVICRIFHKNAAAGEKKNVMSYNNSSWLPPLLECQSEAEMQAFQNPFPSLEKDLKSLLMSSVVSQSTHLSSNYSHLNPISNNNNGNDFIISTPSIVFKSQELRAAEANTNFIMGMKMEPNSNFIMLKQQQQQQQYPVFCEMGCSSTSIPPVSAHDISASIAFNNMPPYHTSTSSMLMGNLGL